MWDWQLFSVNNREKSQCICCLHLIMWNMYPGLEQNTESL